MDLHQEVKLEERSCAGCGKTFKVFHKSPQRYHSELCANIVTDPYRRASQKNQETLGSIGRKEIRKKLELTLKNVTMKTEKKDLNKEKNGEKKTMNGNLQHKESSIVATESTNSKKSTPTVIERIPSEDSKKLLAIADPVISQSVNLIDDSARHLLILMKGVTGHQDSEKVEHFDPNRVNAACNCANNLYQMMKAKIEIMKLAKELNEK